MVEIVWSEPALQDLDEIADYIALDKPDAAARLVKRVFAKVESLRRHPLMGSNPPETRGLPYEELLVGPCRIFYRVEVGKALIVHVRRSERLLDPDHLLDRESRA